MKRDLKFYLPYRFIMAVFYFLVLLTMFLPMISIDSYTEYHFYNTKYANDYTSSYTPLASKITPLQLMQNLWLDDDKIAVIKTDYAIFKNWCDENYSKGNWTKEEYDQYLANAEETNVYYISTIYYGTADYARIQDKVHLISIITIVMYGLALIMFIFNVFNLMFNAKFLYITNAQASWIYATITLAFFIYIFATSITNTIELNNGDVKQYNMVCLSTTGLFIFLLVLEILYSVFSIMISNRFNKYYQRVEEVPADISYKIQKMPKRKKPTYIPNEILENSNRTNNKKKNKGTKKKKGKKHGKKR